MGNSEKLEIIEELAWRYGELYEQYSGRGMYGETCVGIVTATPQILIEEAVEKGIKGAKTDNMGKDYIVYWERIKA